MPSPIATLRNNRSLRAALLGATAAIAVVGFAGQSAFTPARAIAATSQSVAPMSFADTVERVRGAVVSVKVNIVESSASEDGDSPGMPRLQPGDPLEKFFRQFGEQNGIPGMPGGRQRPWPS